MTLLTDAELQELAHTLPARRRQYMADVARDQEALQHTRRPPSLFARRWLRDAVAGVLVALLIGVVVVLAAFDWEPE